MPVGVPNWLGLQQRLDRLVDLRWAEQCELHPWTGGGYSTDGMADPTRKVLKTAAVFVTPGAAITGESGSAHGGGGSTQQLEEETWISIQEDLLGNPATWKAYDRVFMPFRKAWYTIAWVSPSATRRPQIHMLRMQPAQSGLALSAQAHRRIAEIQAHGPAPQRGRYTGRA